MNVLSPEAKKLISQYQWFRNTENGRDVLDDLCRQCPTFRKAANMSNLDPQQLAYREGQRAILCHIFTKLSVDPMRLMMPDPPEPYANFA